MDIILKKFFPQKDSEYSLKLLKKKPIDYSYLCLNPSRRNTYDFRIFRKLKSLFEEIYFGCKTVDAIYRDQDIFARELERLNNYGPRVEPSISNRRKILENAKHFYERRVMIIDAFDCFQCPIDCFRCITEEMQKEDIHQMMMMMMKEIKEIMEIMEIMKDDQEVKDHQKIIIIRVIHQKVMIRMDLQEMQNHQEVIITNHEQYTVNSNKRLFQLLLILIQSLNIFLKKLLWILKKNYKDTKEILKIMNCINI